MHNHNILQFNINNTNSIHIDFTEMPSEKNNLVYFTKIKHIDMAHLTIIFSFNDWFLGKRADWRSFEILYKQIVCVLIRHNVINM